VNRESVIDIQLTQEVDGYGIYVDSPGGQARAEFKLPYTADEIQSFLQHIRKHPKNVMDDRVRAFGQTLFDTAVRNNSGIAGCFQRSIALSHKEGLPLMLRLSNTPDLAELPWEYLFDGGRGNYLAHSTITPIVRFLDVPMPQRARAADLPLRMLVMISSPTDQVQLNVEAEWTLLKEELQDLEEAGKLVITKMEDATLDNLRQHLMREDVHIFHYLGHGTFDPTSDSGSLIFENDDETSHFVSAEPLGALLHDHLPLRLVVLNACWAGRTSNTDIFSGVGQLLVTKGIPASVAMQFAITDKSAVIFAKAFYDALAESFPVERAVTEGRRSLLANGRFLEWGTPVLYTGSKTGYLFDFREEKPTVSEDDKKDAEEESGGISINIGGKVGGNVNTAGRDLHLTQGPTIGSVGGDYVAGDQTIHGDKVQGDKHFYGASPAYAQAFEQARKQLEGLGLNQYQEEEVKGYLETVEEIAGKPDTPTDKLDYILGRMETIAPKVVEVLVNALLEPGAVAATATRLLLETVRKRLKK